MTPGNNNRGWISWYVTGDRYAYAAIAVLLVVLCAGFAVLSALTAPTIESIAQSVKPQPTPTITLSEPGDNIALRKPVTVSAELPGFPALFAVDANPDYYWGSGGFAPQWIEIDLQGQYVISEIRLLPSQTPPGDTTHQLFVKGTYTKNRYVLLHTFEGFTADGRWIALQLPEPIRGVRFVKIKTTSSPSWVSWREIQIITGE